MQEPHLAQHSALVAEDSHAQSNGMKDDGMIHGIRCPGIKEFSKIEKVSSI